MEIINNQQCLSESSCSGEDVQALEEWRQLLRSLKWHVLAQRTAAVVFDGGMASLSTAPQVAILFPPEAQGCKDRDVHPHTHIHIPSPRTHTHTHTHCVPVEWNWEFCWGLSCNGHLFWVRHCFLTSYMALLSGGWTEWVDLLPEVWDQRTWGFSFNLCRKLICILWKTYY